MRIHALSVRNFRAITRLDLSGLGDMVVLAGPNGCGKSNVFDAIRLLKSAYGGYQPNEWQSWFGEFQINVNQRQANWLVLFQDRAKALTVSMDVTLSSPEQAYLREHSRELLTEQIWKEVTPELATWRSIGATPLAAHLRVHQPEVEHRVAGALPTLEAELEREVHVGKIVISSDGEVSTTPSLVLELIFSHYEPQSIGIIDYHGPNRNYGREQVGGINLSIEGSEDRLRQHALYNYTNKYANLKTEMAGDYIRHVLARQADESAGENESLSDTLKELFSTFFPGKEFLGPRPTADGRLTFPVRIQTGAEHDIDDLSSGEKEVLYGYLRLRNTAPKHSVLLIDEPELHLNPRLISGLASFYHRHLGRSLNNQLWLVTHSDTLIREAVGQKDFSVFHMQPAGQYQGPSQASRIEARQDLERLVIELVGDLAAYRPGAKIVVFEGGGVSEFDVRMVTTLFPRFQAIVNPIAGGNRRLVEQMYELLEDARKAGHLPAKFYAVTDSDGEPAGGDGLPARYSWDVYHIENYLLEPSFILAVLTDLNATNPPVDGIDGVLACLKSCAQETVGGLIAHRLRTEANKAMVQCLHLNFDPACRDIPGALVAAANRSRARLEKTLMEEITPHRLQEMEQDLQFRAERELRDDVWRKTFRGRDILRRFVSRHGGGIRYEAFRDLIVARMRDAEYQPPGMKHVIDQILADPW
jgi:predicted ATPase